MAVTFTPTVADVGALLRARTKNDVGAEIGTFTTATRPTDTQVTTLIQRAVRHVAAKIGAEDPCTEDLKTEAGELAALYAAMLVELSYYPEQVNANRSAYPEYKDLFESGIGSLTEAVEEICGTTTASGTGGATQQKPSFNFDTNLPPLPKETRY